MEGLDNISEKVGALIKKVNDQDTPFTLTPYNRIGNNRTYLLHSGEETFFVKYFFQNEGDLRDRFNTELAFIRYAEKAAPGFTPRILAVDPVSKLILYEYIQGKPLNKESISENEVKQAADFFKKLNNKASHSDSVYLPNASEACFSIAEHIKLIDDRIGQLSAIIPSSQEDIEGLILVNRMKSIWVELVSNIHTACGIQQIGLNEELPFACRVLSPSDFGFHNALTIETGKLIFLDFEYAGWDDPAKMSGDFFAQIQVPVPAEMFEDFLNLAFSELPRQNYLKKRARILLPLFHIKWACIAMNIFLPVHLERRKFSNPGLEVAGFKRNQLQKTVDILQTFQNKNNVIH